jgi:hypothetical protein
VGKTFEILFDVKEVFIKKRRKDTTFSQKMKHFIIFFENNKKIMRQIQQKSDALLFLIVFERLNATMLSFARNAL